MYPLNLQVGQYLGRQRGNNRLNDWKPDIEPDIDSKIWPGLCHILQADEVTST